MVLYRELEFKETKREPTTNRVNIKHSASGRLKGRKEFRNMEHSASGKCQSCAICVVGVAPLALFGD